MAVPLGWTNLVDYSATVPNTSTQIRPAVSRRAVLVLHNASASVNVAVNLTGAAAAINAAGSIMMAPGTTMYLDAVVPTNAIFAIAASGTVPLTCYAHESPA